MRARKLSKDLYELMQTELERDAIRYEIERFDDYDEYSTELSNRSFSKYVYRAKARRASIGQPWVFVTYETAMNPEELNRRLKEHGTEAFMLMNEKDEKRYQLHTM